MRYIMDTYPGFIFTLPKCKTAFKSSIKISGKISRSPMDTPPVVINTSTLSNEL